MREKVVHVGADLDVGTSKPHSLNGHASLMQPSDAAITPGAAMTLNLRGLAGATV
jgi:hypothetical protein